MIPEALFRILGDDASAIAFRSALGNAQNTATKITGLFKAAFAGISVAGVASIVNQRIAFGDELAKIQAKTGLTGRAVSELAHVFRAADLDTQDFASSFRFMNKAMSEAETGLETPARAFRAIGVEVSQLKRLAPDKQFELLAQRISEIKDPAEKSRAATELFGRSGADLLPMFEKGAAGIRAARLEAVKLGQSFSEDQIKKLSEADAAIKRLKFSWENFATTLSANVAPALSHVLDSLAGVGVQGQESRMNQLRFIMERSGEYTQLYKDAAAELSRLESLTKLQEGWASGQVGQGGSTRGRYRPSKVVGYAAAEAGEAAKDAAEQRAQAFLKTQQEIGEEVERGMNRFFGSMRDLEEENATDVRASLDEQTQAYSDAEKTRYDNWRTVQNVMKAEAQENAELMRGFFVDGFMVAFMDGADSMADYFIGRLKYMAAEAAATGIFDLLNGAGSGSGIGKAFGFAKKLFGFADGGSFKVGGSGGVDSQLVAFRASPDERVTITKPGQGMGAPVIHISQHIDARGATADLAKALPGILKQNNDLLTTQIITGIRRGAYAL